MFYSTLYLVVLNCFATSFTNKLLLTLSQVVYVCSSRNYYFLFINMLAFFGLQQVMAKRLPPLSTHNQIFIYNVARLCHNQNCSLFTQLLCHSKPHAHTHVQCSSLIDFSATVKILKSFIHLVTCISACGHYIMV